MASLVAICQNSYIPTLRGACIARPGLFHIGILRIDCPASGKHCTVSDSKGISVIEHCRNEFWNGYSGFWSPTMRKGPFSYPLHQKYTTECIQMVDDSRSDEFLPKGV